MAHAPSREQCRAGNGHWARACWAHLNCTEHTLAGTFICSTDDSSCMLHSRTAAAGGAGAQSGCWLAITLILSVRCRLRFKAHTGLAAMAAGNHAPEAA